MRLEVNHDLREGEWQIATAYINDGEVRFGLNPNQHRTIRIFFSDDQWKDFDLDRLEIIWSKLTEQMSGAKVLPS